MQGLAGGQQSAYFFWAGAMGNGDGIIFLGDDSGAKGAAGVGVSPRLGPGQEARGAPRKAVSGRVRVVTDSGVKQAGRLVDMSALGFCALLDDPVKAGVLCLIDCEVTVRGSPGAISAIAKAIQSILVSGKGYRVGFQFTRISDGSSDVVRALLS